MDPMMGLVGAAVIGKWAWGLMRKTGSVLLDHSDDRELPEEVRARLTPANPLVVLNKTDLEPTREPARPWAAPSTPG